MGIRRQLRSIAAVVAVALVTTALATSGTGGGSASSPDDADDRFAMTVGRPDLAHVGDEVDLTVEIGPERRGLPAGNGDDVAIDGTRDHSGLLRVRDDEGRVAGLAVVPKDDDALLGLTGGDPLAVPVNYRTTAFALFAQQPFVATTEPVITVLQASLVVDLPEFAALTEALEDAAAADPGYLETLPEPVTTATAALLDAYTDEVERKAEAIAAMVSENDGEGEPDPTDPSNPGTTPPTTQSLRRQPGSDDPDDCPPTEEGPLIVLDATLTDKVCITRAVWSSEKGAWHIHGRNTSPRWVLATAASEGLMADGFGVVPGKALDIPRLQDLVVDMATALGLGLVEDAFNVGVTLCNGIASLFGKECADQPTESAIVRNIIDKLRDYTGPVEFDFQLPGGEEQTVLHLSGLGGKDTGASGVDVALSWYVTVITAVVVPLVALALDNKPLSNRGVREEPNGERMKTLVEELRTATAGAEGSRALTELQARLVNGDFKGSLEAFGQFLLELTEGVAMHAVSKFIRSLIDEGYAHLGRILEDAVLAIVNPVRKFEQAVGIVNLFGTVAMLVWDYPQLHTSARYALGYDERPEDPGSPPPGDGPICPAPPCDTLPNPPLPDDACGLKVAVVLDGSASISDAGAEGEVRSAATGLIDALGGTPSRVHLSSFAGTAHNLLGSGWTPLDDPQARRRAREAAAAAPADADTGTNWEAALSNVVGLDPDLVVFVTDGNPNTYGVGLASGPSDAATVDFDPAALAAGVSVANVLKNAGARIVAVGVGVTNDSALAQVSGAAEGSDHYSVSDFGDLGSSLATIATELCGTSVTVVHEVDGQPAAGAEYTLNTGDGPERSTATSVDGTVRFGLQARTGGHATVRGPDDLPLEGITCDRAATIDEDIVTVDVDVDDGAVSCTFSWRSLPSGSAAVAEVARGPGQVRVLNFVPQPGAGDAMIGCLGGCGTIEFGVSFSGGFAVLRYNAVCPGCSEATTQQIVAADGGAVRFRLDAGSGALTPYDPSQSWHLDLRVRGSAGGVLREPAFDVRGTVGPEGAFSVNVPRPPPLLHVCVVSMVLSGIGNILAENRKVETGTGC